jgi:hypothetical protein
VTVKIQGSLLVSCGETGRVLSRRIRGCGEQELYSLTTDSIAVSQLVRSVQVDLSRETIAEALDFSMTRAGLYP